jgi:hypothetical protein
LPFSPHNFHPTQSDYFAFHPQSFHTLSPPFQAQFYFWHSVLQIRPKVRTYFKKHLQKAHMTWWFTLKERSFWRQYILGWHFLWIASVLELNVNLLSMIVPKYPYSSTLSTFVRVDRGLTIAVACWSVDHVFFAFCCCWLPLKERLTRR